MVTPTQSTESAKVIALRPRMRKPPKTWRAQVGALLARAEEVMLDTKDRLLEDACCARGTYVRTLIGESVDLCGRDADVLLCGAPMDYYGWVVLPAVAMLTGAQAMNDVHPQLGGALQPAIDALEEAALILDQAEAGAL